MHTADNTMAKKKWIATIHVAKAKTGLNDDAYRALLSAAGVNSAAEINTWEQYKTVMAGFKKLGFIPRPAKNKDVEPQEKRNPAWISEKQELYIRGLWNLVSVKKSDSSLDAFCKRICGSDSIRWLLRKDASKVIVALREMAVKLGINPDKK